MLFFATPSTLASWWCCKWSPSENHHAGPKSPPAALPPRWVDGPHPDAAVGVWKCRAATSDHRRRRRLSGKTRWNPRTRMPTHMLKNRNDTYLSHFPANPLCGTPGRDRLRWHSCRTPLLDTIAQRSGKTLLLDTLVGHSCLTLL